jgi:hypothetical protein
MKLAGKPGTGDPYAGFDEAGAGNGQIPSTAPVLDPTDEGELEIELRLLRQFPTLPIFQVYYYRRFPLLTLILMGDWCSEGCNRNLKEISAKAEMVVTGYWNSARN